MGIHVIYEAQRFARVSKHLISRNIDDVLVYLQDGKVQLARPATSETVTLTNEELAIVFAALKDHKRVE